MAAVRTAQGVENVVTTFVDPVAAGELVLVHAGTAISRVGDEDAGMAGIEGATQMKRLDEEDV
jgi:hydrogenase maturation factor